MLPIWVHRFFICKFLSSKFDIFYCVAGDNPRYPLSYLFENTDAQSFCTMTLDSLSMDDTISHMCYAINVQPGFEVDGEVLIGAKYLYFIASHILNEKVKFREYILCGRFSEFFNISPYFRSLLPKPKNFPLSLYLKTSEKFIIADSI